MCKAKERKVMLDAITKRYYRRCLKKARQRLQQCADELYYARRLMPEKEEDINQILDEVVYPCLRDLEKMRVDAL